MNRKEIKKCKCKKEYRKEFKPRIQFVVCIHNVCIQFLSAHNSCKLEPASIYQIYYSRQTTIYKVSTKTVRKGKKLYAEIKQRQTVQFIIIVRDNTFLFLVSDFAIHLPDQLAFDTPRHRASTSPLHDCILRLRIFRELQLNKQRDALNHYCTYLKI